MQVRVSWKGHLRTLTQLSKVRILLNVGRCALSGLCGEARRTVKDMTEQIVLDGTPEVKRVLDRAASAWPDQSKAELLDRLVSVGADHREYIGSCPVYFAALLSPLCPKRSGSS